MAIDVLRISSHLKGLLSVKLKAEKTFNHFCVFKLTMKKGLLLLCVTINCLADEPSPERQATLRNLLKNDCGACHGLTLQGGMGPALLPDSLAGKSDELLVSTILNGRKGTAMPLWQTFMNYDEALWLVEVLRKTSR